MTSRMTATDELRRLLDERGAEYTFIPGDEYSREHIKIGSTEIWTNGRDEVAVYFITPEQAVDAALGRGTCRKLPSSGEKICTVTHIKTGMSMDFGYWKCSECGCECFEGAKYCMNCGRKVVDA